MSEDIVVYPDFSTSRTEPSNPVKYTEDAHAKLLVDSLNGELRYVAENDKWHFHNSIYWEEINKL